MSKGSEQVQLMLPMPLGAQYVEELRNHSVEAVRAQADNPEAQAVFDAVHQVMSERPSFGALHSALCAMSLPVRRPKDEFAPIIRRDGNYTLIIRPIERMQMVDGELVPINLGVPFGVHARLVMLFIMTQAVKQRSREIFIGNSFAAWMRRMGIEHTNSGGRRASRSLIQEQIDRLMACEWTIRWDQDAGRAPADKGRSKRGSKKEQDATISAFAVNDMRLVNQYGGVSTAGGEFVSRFVLSEPFYENLVMHSVPLNERAFAALKKSATQIDLYTYLAYRLPRIREGEEVIIKWSDLANHLGNDSSTPAKFRQTVRKAWVTVSGVYQQARNSVCLDDLVVRLRHAAAPIDNHILKRGDGRIELVSANSESADEGREVKAISAPGPLFRFPAGKIRWSVPWKDIARAHGSNNDVDTIGERFRAAVGSELEFLEGDRLINRFTKFCQSLPAPQ